MTGEVLATDGGQCLGRGALDMLEELRAVHIGGSTPDPGA